MPHSSAIEAFYSGNRKDGLPLLSDVLNADYEWLEANHNWCQLAYPNFERSEVVPNAPVLDENTLAWLKYEGVTEKILKLVFKLVKHYSELSVDRIPHNNRRVTRLIKFLKLMEMDDIAETAFIIFSDSLSLHSICAINTFSMAETLTYWSKALEYEKDDEWLA